MSLSKTVITSDVTLCLFCFLLSFSRLVFRVQLSLSEPSRRRTKRQVLVDDGDTVQQQIGNPQAAITLVTSPRKSFLMVRDLNKRNTGFCHVVNTTFIFVTKPRKHVFLIMCLRNVPRGQLGV